MPDGIVRELAAAQRQDSSLGIAGIHIFTFGGVASAPVGRTLYSAAPQHRCVSSDTR